MKRIVLILCAGLLALGLSACGKSGEKKPEAAAPAAESAAPPGVANPYATQLKVMGQAKDLKAESGKRVADEKSRESALDQR